MQNSIFYLNIGKKVMLSKLRIQLIAFVESRKPVLLVTSITVDQYLLVDQYTGHQYLLVDQYTGDQYYWWPVYWFTQGGKNSFGHSQPFQAIPSHSQPFLAIPSHS